MNRSHLSTGLLAIALMASPAAAHAAGVNLSWTNCYPDGAISNRSFACDTNAGTNVAIGSYVTPASELADVIALDIVLAVATEGSTLPAWWQMRNADTCRKTAMSVSAVFPESMSQCVDYWQNQASAGSYYKPGTYGAATAQLLLGVFVSNLTRLGPQAGNTEYASFALSISNIKTVGGDACAGCDAAACIVLNGITVNTYRGQVLKLSGGAAGPGSDAITWQGGGGITSNLGAGCPAATPTRNRTWGQIKSLYR